MIVSRAPVLSGSSSTALRKEQVEEEEEKEEEEEEEEEENTASGDEELTEETKTGECEEIAEVDGSKNIECNIHTFFHLIYN